LRLRRLLCSTHLHTSIPVHLQLTSILYDPVIRHHIYFSNYTHIHDTVSDSYVAGSRPHLEEVGGSAARPHEHSSVRPGEEGS
jgi:hypothetical protein